MKRRVIAILAAIALLLAGCGTQEQEQQEKYSVCVVLKAMDSIHWMSVENGLEQAALDYDLDISVLWPSNESEVATQEAILSDVIESQPDAMAAALCDSESSQQYMQQAKEAGIQTLYIDEEALEDDGIPYVGSDNYNAGRMAAEELAAQLPAGASVAVISGNERQSSHINRVNGFRDYIENETDLQLVAVESVPDSTMSGGQQQMAALLAQYPDISGVFCSSAMIVMGAMQQCEDTARTDIKLVGMDTQSDALRAVQDGQILAMVGQNGYEIGYQTIAIIAAMLNGDSVPDTTYVENNLITQDNVESYLEEYLTEGRES